VRIQKTLIQRWEELPTSQAIAAGVDAFEQAWRGEEPSSALRRFLAERLAAKAR